MELHEADGSASQQCLISEPRSVAVKAGAALTTWDLSMETAYRAGKECMEK